MRIIGLDASLDVCKGEGYMMVAYDARKKFNPDMEYRAFAYNPDYLREHDEVNDFNIDEMISFNRLNELYLEDKESIDGFAETNKFINFDNPTYYDFLYLASDVGTFKGFN